VLGPDHPITRYLTQEAGIGSDDVHRDAGADTPGQLP
jgi:hypothetical protein